MRCEDERRGEEAMEADGSDAGSAGAGGITPASIPGDGEKGGGVSGSGGGGVGGSNGGNGTSNNGSSLTLGPPAASQGAEESIGAGSEFPQPPPPPSATSQPAPSPVAGLAKDAAMLFKALRYAECLRVLEQLLQKKEDDPKVLHNIAVAEYYRDGCTDPQRLLDVLAKVKRRSEELARAEEEQLEGIGTASLISPNVSSLVGSRSSTSLTTGGSGGQGQPIAPSGSGLGGGDAVAYMDDYDTSIPTLNTAVIFYHLQQYATALSVLEPLYQNIEPIDETAALRVCMLMLDITLAAGQPTKAAAVLQTMEKSFGYSLSPGEGGASIQSQPAIQTQLLSSAGGSLPFSGDSSHALSSGGPSSLINSPSGELRLTRTSSEEVLDEDTLSLSLDVEGGRPSLPLPTGLSRVPNVEKILPAPVVDLKLMLHLYKVRLLMLTRNHRATKREVKCALNLSRDHLTALVLKAQLEYSRANYRKAIKLLSTWSSRVESMDALFLSNLGCIHHQLLKNQTAAVFFRKALQANASLSKESPLKLNTFSQDKSLSILYNAGLQQLICGNPILAACCFQEAGSLYYNQPLLWLRLAECCIMALEKGLLDSGSEHNFAGKREDIKVSVIGDGKYRHVVLPAGSLTLTATNGLNLESHEAEEKSNVDQAPKTVEGTVAAPEKQQKLSMGFACQCLYTALHLLDKRDAKAAEAAAAVAADAVDVNDVDDVSSSTVSQSQKNGTSEKKGTITPVSGGASSQVSPNGDGKESKVTSGTSGTITLAIAALEEEKRREHFVIRQTVLADLAYVHLSLQNPLQALKTASTLLSQPDCIQIYAFLGRIYAAEALCLLDRSREAADYLSVCLMENSTVESSVGSEEDGQKWKSGDNSEASGDGEDSTSVSPYTVASGALPEALNVAKASGSRARASLYVNLAAVYVMQGDLAQARQWATQAVTVTPANPLAVLAVVYVDLLSGQREEAISMLKRCRHLCVVSPNKVLWQKD